MTNGGIIEGNTGDISALRDLSPVISYAGQQYWTDDCDWWSKRFGLMLGSQRGTSIWGGRYGLWPATAPHNMSPHYRRKIGNPIAEKEARLRPQHITLLGCCLGNTKGNAAACVLAGHHHSPSRNRIKTGHYFFGSGAGPSNTGSLWRN